MRRILPKHEFWPELPFFSIPGVVQAGEGVRWEALYDAAGVHDRAWLMGLKEVRKYAG